MKKIVSKKGKTFAQVAKPIQNLIEKLKDRPKSQANDNTIMLLEKQLDDLFAKQEAIKEAENPQPEMPIEQPMQGMQQMQQPMGQPMGEQMPMAPEGQPMEQPAMAYGGYIPKFYNGGIPYVGQVGTAYNDPNMSDEQIQNIRNSQYAYSQGIQDPFSNPIGASAQQANALRRAQAQGVPYTDQGVADFSTLGTANPSSTPQFNPIAPRRGFLPVSKMNVPATVNNATQQYVTPTTPTGVYNPGYNPNTNVSSDAVQTQNETTKSNKRPFDRWGEVGAIGTSIGALTQEMRNIENLKRPGMLQNVYLTAGAAPDKVDYTAEQERLNTDVAAAREANRLAGGNPAVLGQLRAEQLRRRGEIMQGQENENTALMNQFKQAQAEAAQKSQGINADIAKENMYNIYGYDQNQIAQRNAAIAAGANTIGGVFNNMTNYQNQLKVADIMARSHPGSVWSDSGGNLYTTGPNGEQVPVAKTKENVQAAQQNTQQSASYLGTPFVNYGNYTNPYDYNYMTMKNTATKEDQMNFLRNELKNTKDPNQKNLLTQQLLKLNSQKAFGGMKYADGGNVYKQKLSEVLNRDTVSRAKQMDVEYAQALKNKQDTYKSSITGLEYKVLPRTGKDLYAANLWQETHGTAPTKAQTAATKKAIQGKPTNSIKAVAAVQNANQSGPSESNDMFRMISDNTLGKNPMLGSMGNRSATSMPEYVASQLGVGAPDKPGARSSNPAVAAIQDKLKGINERYDLSKGTSKWEKPNIPDTPKPQIQGQPWMGKVAEEKPIGKPSFKTETYGRDNTATNMSPRAKGSGKATEAPVVAKTKQALSNLNKELNESGLDFAAGPKMVYEGNKQAAETATKYGKTAYNAVKKLDSDLNNKIKDVEKTVFPTSIRALAKDIMHNQLGLDTKITEKDLTESQKRKVLELAAKKLKESKTKGASTAVNSYDDYEDGANGILSQFGATKNVRNTIGKFNPVQKGDTLYIKEAYNFNEKDNNKVIKAYGDWVKDWKNKGYSSALAYVRALGSKWGSAGSETGDDSKGTPMDIRLYNPQKKKKS